MAHSQLKTIAQVQEFLDSNGGFAVVDLFATWCPPCKAISPYVTKKNEETKIPLITIDVDESAELSQGYQVSAMPTFLVIQGKWNNVVEKVVGGGQANVNKVYDKAITLKK